MKSHLRDWGAIYILLILFLGSWWGQFVFQAVEYSNNARTHGEWPDWSEFLPEFWAATFENWQSEFLQLAVQALLIASWLQRYTFRADHNADKDDIAELRGQIHALREELRAQ